MRTKRPPMLIRSAVFRRLIGPVPDQPEPMIEHEPGCWRDGPPVVFLPDEIDLVQALLPAGEQSDFITELRGGKRYHGATRVGWLEPGAVTHEGAFGRRVYQRTASINRTRWTRSTLPQVDTGMLCTSYVIDRYFGHWLNDGLLLETLAHDMSCVALGARAEPWLHEPRYRARLAYDRPVMAHASRLAIVDDRGMNHGRIARLKRLRARLGLPGAPASPHYLFMRRGSAGVARELVNEDEIVSLLLTHGHRVIDPERCSVDTLLTAISQSAGVIGVEGSGFAHAVLALRSNAVAIVIQPPQRASLVQKHWFDALDIRVAQVIAQPQGDAFRLAPSRLLALINHIEALRR